MKLLYVSTGNIPSRWAHTFQVMKMAEALSGRVASLTLLTAGTLWPSPTRNVDLASWYGLRRRFRVARLPVRLWQRQPFFEHTESRAFDLAAAIYARLTAPDLVYARSPRAGALCARYGLPTVIENHTGTASHFFAPIVEAARLPSFRGVVTVTDHLRDEYVKAGISPEKIFVWPDAVDPQRIDEAPDRESARRWLGLPARSPLAVYCGHFYPEKGVPTLLEAARLAPEVTFVLVGGWPDDVEAARRQCLGMANVRFEGFVDNDRIPSYLSAADVLLLPNSARGEHARATSPLKLFEYMAARRPIAATRIPAFEGLLDHGENAWIVDPDSPRSLAAGVRQLLAQPEWGRRIAEAAHRQSRDFTWERRADDILHHFSATVPEILS